jgi:hypothetical protein
MSYDLSMPSGWTRCVLALDFERATIESIYVSDNGAAVHKRTYAHRDSTHMHSLFVELTVDNSKGTTALNVSGIDFIGTSHPHTSYCTVCTLADKFHCTVCTLADKSHCTVCTLADKSHCTVCTCACVFSQRSSRRCY